MSLIWSIFFTGIGLLFTLFGLWFASAIFYHILSSEVPPAICQPLKFRILSIMFNMGVILDDVVWKMGITHRYKLMRAAINGIPPWDDPMLCIENAFFDGVRVRIYRPKQSLIGQRRGIVFTHGGGGMFCSIEAYERLCRYIAKESDSVMVSIGYHLAPEHPHPTLFNECRKAIEHFMRNADKYGVDHDRIVLAGDSMGGTVTAYLCQEFNTRTDLPRIHAQVLLYPSVQWFDPHLPSYRQNCNVGFLTKDIAMNMAFQYLNVGLKLNDMLIIANYLFMQTRPRTNYNKWVNPDIISKELGRNINPDSPPSPVERLICIGSQMLDPKLSPLLVADSAIKGLPEAFILTCEHDILRDDGVLYKTRLEDNGVPVTYCHVGDMFHGFLAMFNHWLFNFPSAKTATDHIITYIKQL